MIRFICEHCGSSVRTADDLVGKKARCPDCAGIVVIPLKSSPQPKAPAPRPETRALRPAAAAPAAAPAAHDTAPVPPPPRKTPSLDADPEEVDLPSGRKDPSAETDILVMEGGGTVQSRHSSTRFRTLIGHALSAHSGKKGRRAKSPARMWMVVAVVAVVVVAALAVIYLLELF